MAKGYWIGHVDVADPEGYKDYIRANADVFAKYGARFVVRGGQHVVKEGASRARTVVIEFDDYATALACYESGEYADVMARRLPYSTADLLIVEGYDGAPPVVG
ncbi:DUF1330 domain-containing protein [Massilia rhizosphaerae]|uniref:DUF1330 domain-containing protein n=1 Tax=Massilia rhizosphaerae TaxID=2784389 RepID=UPI0018DCA948|nr:DUF1330 domain-containing protein [Massilia rhizosphaerae]